MRITQAHALTVKACAGCCGDDSWRGHLCTYHEGYDDGIEVAFASQQEVIDAAATLAEVVDRHLSTKEEGSNE